VPGPGLAHIASVSRSSISKPLLNSGGNGGLLIGIGRGEIIRNFVYQAEEEYSIRRLLS
jgi:hypothetical protein